MNYKNKKWINFAHRIRLERNDKCEICGKEGNCGVHHKKPVFEDSPYGDWFSPDNVMVLCVTCHNYQHERGGNKEIVTHKQVSLEELVELFGNEQVAYSVYMYLKQYWRNWIK